MRAKDGVVVYDLLGKLEVGLAQEAGIQLIAIAGQLGHLGGGYLFEKKSADYLDGVMETPVYDENSNLAGKIPAPNCFFSYVYMGMGEPKLDFDPTNHQYRMEAPISDQAVDVLWDMRRGILDQLKTRGKEAHDEYKLASAAMGGKKMGAEELETMLKKMLGL